LTCTGAHRLTGKNCIRFTAISSQFLEVGQVYISALTFGYIANYQANWPLMQSFFKTAFPYADDIMNLPVRDLKSALPFYQTVMGFTVVTENESPVKSAILLRDQTEIGLSENGGEPEQEGCFFEVDNVETAFAELKANGLEREEANYRVDEYGGKKFKVFFVVAPDGLCFCIGERVG
jgi:catechol 2,3-dioxygenase-like lactoylglutathione lyase family enzyme